MIRSVLIKGNIATIHFTRMSWFGHEVVKAVEYVQNDTSWIIRWYDADTFEWPKEISDKQMMLAQLGYDPRQMFVTHS